MNVSQMVESRSQPGPAHYLTPGRHIQLVGSQSGGFQPFGHHVANEMGGIWMHPIKLLDGFWLGVTADDDDIDWLTDATRYENHAFYNVLEFSRNRFDVKRTEFSAQSFAGLVIEFTIRSTSAETSHLDCVLSVQSDLQPVWYSETANILDGPDESFDDSGDFLAKDRDHDWFVRCRVEGVDATLALPEAAIAGDPVFGSGRPGFWSFPIDLEPGGSKTFTLKIAGSLDSAAQTRQRIDSMAQPHDLFSEKRDFYEGILSRSRIELPATELEKQFAWSKCHIEWLTITSEPVGTGLVAGIPEYVWWFGVDSAYALKGCLPAGFHELAEQTLAIIHDGSQRENGNGRIIHEENSYGVVGNRGNAQETALFIHTLYETYRWTGNAEWISSYWPAIRQSLRYLLEDQMSPGSLFPYGSGVMEGRGLTGEVIDTAVYTQAALKDASEVAALVGENELAVAFAVRARDMAEDIRSVMWLEDEGLFADVRATGTDVVSILDQLAKQSEGLDRPELVNQYTELATTFRKEHSGHLEKRTPFCFKNWVIDTPLEMGLATRQQAEVALGRLNSPEFVGTWGSYLSGDGDARMMTISTAVHINSNLAFGNADMALDLMRRVMATYSMYLPGSITEMSPDYGCFVQAWTAYAMISPLITGFLGLYPDSGKAEIRIEPCLPSGWDFLNLRNVKIGQDSFDFEVRRVDDNTYSVSVDATSSRWKVTAAPNTAILGL